VDRPAVYSRTGFPSEDPSYDRLKAYLQDHTEQKVGWSSGRIESTYPTRSQREPHSEDWERRITVLETPAGELTSSRLVSLKGQPGLHERYAVNNREEAEIYLSLPIPKVEGDVSDFFEAREKIAEVGVAEVALGFNSGGFVAELCGSENFATMSITDRDTVHALCERHMTILSNRAKFLLEKGAGPFFSLAGQEYIVPPLHGWSDFCDFNVRYDKPIIDLIHEAGGRVHVHCHGSIKSVIRGFVDMGVDVLHPFEPPPMGDITPAEAKAHARGKLCLEGNTQINRMYEAMPEEISEETAALIRDAFDDQRGLIVCPTASPYIRGEGENCFPQYKAMIDTVLEWSG
jgi:hypothetical protein